MHLTDKGNALAKLCAIFCADQNFRTFLMRHLPDADQVETADQAVDLVRQICEVKSRKEFDNDPAAAERFHEKIRIPYVNWQLGRDA